MFRDRSKVIEDLTVLYELSLAAGSSLNIQENCEIFMKVLMSRKNLSFAGFWVLGPQAYRASLIKGIPYAKINQPDVVMPREFIEKLNSEKALIINPTDKLYKFLEHLIIEPSGGFIIFQLEGQTLLILNRITHPFVEFEKKQLENVIVKFGFFMAGLFYREKLFEKETIISMQLKDLDHKNKELKKYIDSNLQLENFAYIASHDLKAPMRTVNSFAHLLLDSAYDKFSIREKEFLRIILNSSENMMELVDDLLLYSRANTKDLNLKNVNIRELVENLLYELQNEIIESQATIECGELPENIFVDEVKIRQLMQNLIINALKFKNQLNKPVVKIYAEENPASWTFAVQDNGIGIKKEYQDRIFDLFQKLHGNGKYRGSGIGLALCKQICLQHDGKIWVNSNPDQGSTFYFTLSKNLKIKEIA